MLLKFEVNIANMWLNLPQGGQTLGTGLANYWAEARYGTILADGRLGFTLPSGSTGVARPPYWRHTERTTRQPEFRQLCYCALTPEERESAVTRMRRQPEF